MVVDLLFYFAMSRLLAADEADRADSESASSHQRAQDVPGFLALRTGEWYKARYEELLRNAIARQNEETKPLIFSGFGS